LIALQFLEAYVALPFENIAKFKYLGIAETNKILFRRKSRGE
jgi:hypothetical protein